MTTNENTFFGYQVEEGQIKKWAESGCKGCMDIKGLV
jgi:hypothetical protein